MRTMLSMRKITHLSVVFVLLALLVYSRFVNLGWGLPYPMHPDERNMADAITRLRCDKPTELISGIITYAPRNVITYLTIGEFAVPNPQVECLNPHFFAYGQLSLYIGYAIAQGIHLVGQLTGSIPNVVKFNFGEAVMGLRLWSALASCLIPLVLLQILWKLNPLFERRMYRYGAFLLFIFSPVLIQFAHFGTTEAVLMLWYVILTYLAIVAVQREKLTIPDLVLMGVVSGLAIATKVSSLLYLTIPWIVIFVKTSSAHFVTLSTLVVSLSNRSKGPLQQSTDNIILDSPRLDETSSVVGTGNPPYQLTDGVIPDSIRDPVLLMFWLWLKFIITVGISILFTSIVAGIVSFIFSPHNFISLRELLGSMHYEADVGLGGVIPFYTRQFLLELPILFQVNHIFPFAFGLTTFILSVLGLLILPYSRSYNILRFTAISYAALTMSWYAKWTRFLAPIYPIMILLAVLTIAYLYQRFISGKFSRRVNYSLGTIILLLCIIPGVAFMSVYTSRDVRFVASEWVYKNIPAGSYVLSETANVIDIPIPDVQNKEQIPDGYNIQYLSFNSYEVDVDRRLQIDLQEAITRADYIFLPSRRVFYNHTCVDLKGKILTTRHSNEKCAYLARTYPVLKKYYEDLFSGKSGFIKVAEFSSYPRIELFGKTILEFPDESAEETFTVFDHPVMRVYKRSIQK